MIRGLLFPAESEVPQWIWVESFEFCTDAVGKLLGPDSPHAGFFRISHGLRRNKDPVNNIEIWYRDAFLFDGSPTNLSINKATRGRAGRPYCGPILFLATQDLSSDFGHYGDMRMRDVRDVVEFLIAYRARPSVSGIPLSGRGIFHDPFES